MGREGYWPDSRMLIIFNNIGKVLGHEPRAALPRTQGGFSRWMDGQGAIHREKPDAHKREDWIPQAPERVEWALKQAKTRLKGGFRYDFRVSGNHTPPWTEGPKGRPLLSCGKNDPRSSAMGRGPS